MTKTVFRVETRTDEQIANDLEATRVGKLFVALAKRRVKEMRQEAAARSAMKPAPVAVVIVAPKAPFKKGVIIPADPAGTERMRKQNADTEAVRLLTHKRDQARMAAEHIYAWMVDAIPSQDEIVRELRAALFVPIEGSPTGYRCEGVVIHTNQVEIEKVAEAREAKRRVLEVLSGTDVTAKLAVLKDEGFELSHNDDRGNAVYQKCGVEVTLFLRGDNEYRAPRGNDKLSPEQMAAKLRRETQASQKECGAESPAARAKREAKRESLRLERISAQPSKGRGGQKDNGHGQQKGGKKNKK